ncbi:hypothetical protein ACSBR2_015186 [Camellia fascicularis]
MDSNSHTLKMCVESFIAVSNLTRRLQSRTSKVQQLTAQLSLFQLIYQDSRREISQLKKQNRELKRKTTMARNLVPWCTSFDGQ